MITDAGPGLLAAPRGAEWTVPLLSTRWAPASAECSGGGTCRDRTVTGTTRLLLQHTTCTSALQRDTNVQAVVELPLTDEGHFLMAGTLSAVDLRAPSVQRPQEQAAARWERSDGTCFWPSLFRSLTGSTQPAPHLSLAAQ